MEEASEEKKFISGESSLKVLKGEAGVILIGFEFQEFEGKNCHIE